MIIVGVEIKGLESLRRKVKAIPQILDDAMWDATFEITELIKQAAELRLSSSMKYSSGELLGSLKNEVVINVQNQIVGRVWSDKQEALFREVGTGPVGEASQKTYQKDLHQFTRKQHGLSQQKMLQLIWKLYTVFLV